jgi:hypothetical protein
MKVGHSLGLLLALASCGPQQQPQQAVNESGAPVLPEASAPPAIGKNTTAETPANAAAPQASLPEPKGPIDPKSVEAAGQVVQHYGALIEQGRWKQSWELWSNPNAARQFDRNWQADREVHLEIVKPGEAEGAAGSIYVTMPVTFYGMDKKGAEFRRPADVILRRVNDVPGSTEAQRRWHIERIEWKEKS